MAIVVIQKVVWNHEIYLAADAKEALAMMWCFIVLKVVVVVLPSSSGSSSSSGRE